MQNNTAQTAHFLTISLSVRVLPPAGMEHQTAGVILPSPLFHSAVPIFNRFHLRTFWLALNLGFHTVHVIFQPGVSAPIKNKFIAWRQFSPWSHALGGSTIASAERSPRSAIHLPARSVMTKQPVFSVRHGRLQKAHKGMWPKWVYVSVC